MLERPDYSVTWAVHVTQSPALAADLSSAVIGASRVDVRTIEPREAAPSALREPTPSGEGSHRLNQPWGPMWRIEVASPRGERERSFLHFITTGPAEAQPPAWRRLTGSGFRGAAGRVDDSGIAVLFAAPAGAGQVALGGPLDRVVIAGLEPGQRYSVSVDATCVLRLGKPTGTAELTATRGGFVRLSAAQCGVK